MLTGVVKRNGYPFAGLPSSYLEAEEYKGLFWNGDPAVVHHVESGYYETNDDRYGTVRFYGSASRLNWIEADFSGRFGESDFVHKHDGLQSLPDFSQCDNLRVWIRKNRSSEELLALITDMGGQILYRIDDHGSFSFGESSEEKYQWHDLPPSPETKRFNTVDPVQIVWRPADSKNGVEAILEFPNINSLSSITSDQQKNNLKFIYRSNYCRWNKDEAFVLAENQSVPGFNNFLGSLLVENETREKKLLIPEKTLEEFHVTKEDRDRQKITEQISGKKNKQPEFHYHIIHLQEDGSLCVQQKAIHNIYLAYLLLVNAKIPEDYGRIPDYIQAAKKYERFTAQELKLWAWLFKPSSRKPDYDPDACAIRLYAAAVVRDNLANYALPATSIKDTQYTNSLSTDENNVVKDWECLSTQAWDRREDSPLTDCVTRYLERRHNVTGILKIENLVDQALLQTWGFGLHPFREITSRRTAKKPFGLAPGATTSFNANSVKQDQKTGLPPFFTRQGSLLKSYFRTMWNDALSEDDKKRRDVQIILTRSSYDNFNNKSHPKNENSLLMVLLQAALDSKEVGEENKKRSQTAGAVVEEIQRRLEEQLATDFMTFTSSPDALKEQLNNYICQYDNQNKLIEATNLDLTALPGFSQTESIAIDEAESELPDNIPSRSFRYVLSSSSFQQFNEEYENYFTKAESSSSAEPTFHCPGHYAEPSTGFIPKQIGLLNQDFIKGKCKNEQLQMQSLKKDAAEIAEKLRNSAKEHWTPKHDSSQKAKAQMIEQANPPDLDIPEHLMKIGATQEKKLTLEDCIILSLQSDFRRYQEKTGLIGCQNLERIRQLHEITGRYLENWALNFHRQRILDKIGQLPTAQQQFPAKILIAD